MHRQVPLLLPVGAVQQQKHALELDVGRVLPPQATPRLPDYGLNREALPSVLPSPLELQGAVLRPETVDDRAHLPRSAPPLGPLGAALYLAVVTANSLARVGCEADVGGVGILRVQRTEEVAVEVLHGAYCLTVEA